jgi:membrane protein DedA with SNARE-associated domain
MIDLSAEIARHGVGIVFANVLIEQAGLPLPAIPTMIAAGALAAEGRISLLSVFGAAVIAGVAADSLWFSVGRWQGRRVLKTVCKIAVSPDSCVRRMEWLYERLGLRSLLFCKFIPGFSTVAPPLAGALNASRWRFTLYDILGVAIWAGSAVGVGALFHRALDKLFGVLDQMGSFAFLAVAAVVAGYIGWRFLDRHRFLRDLRMNRITVDELHTALDGTERPMIVDVRTRWGVRLDPRRIPGAVRMGFDEIEERLADLPRDQEVILYCT